MNMKELVLKTIKKLAAEGHEARYTVLEIAKEIQKNKDYSWMKQDIVGRQLNNLGMKKIGKIRVGKSSRGYAIVSYTYFIDEATVKDLEAKITNDKAQQTKAETEVQYF
jgi:hypothetical protein